MALTTKHLFVWICAFRTVVGSIFFIIALGPICLKCDRVRQPYDCDKTVRCGSHEICYVRKYLTDDGHRWFDVGCEDSQRCTPHVAVGRREENDFNQTTSLEHVKRDRAGELTECRQCCKGNICNKGTVCGASTLVHPGRLICFLCQSEASADGCNQITMCSRDDACFIQSQSIGLGGTVGWISGCKRTDVCKQFVQTAGSNCHACCTHELCNLKCP